MLTLQILDIIQIIWQSEENINGKQILILQLELMISNKQSVKLSQQFLLQSLQRINLLKDLKNNLPLLANMMVILKILGSTQTIWQLEENMFGKQIQIQQ